MIIFSEKQFDTNLIEVVENTYTVKTETPKSNFDELKGGPLDITLEDGDMAYGFNTYDYSDIKISESKGTTTIVFNFVDHNNDLKSQVEELQNIIKLLTEVKG